MSEESAERENLEALKKEAVKIVEDYQGIRGVDLDLKLISRFLNVPNDLILQAISECVQSNQIKRIEYQLPDNRSLYHTFYLPQGSRLV